MLETVYLADRMSGKVVVEYFDIKDLRPQLVTIRQVGEWDLFLWQVL